MSMAALIAKAVADTPLAGFRQASEDPNFLDLTLKYGVTWLPNYGKTGICRAFLFRRPWGKVEPCVP